MLKTATAFDYSGEDRQKLRALGEWMLGEFDKLKRPHLYTLARVFGRGAYFEVARLVRTLVEPGERLVYFEDDAFRLRNLIKWFLDAANEPEDGAIGQLASVLFTDVTQIQHLANREMRATLVRRAS